MELLKEIAANMYALVAMRFQVQYDRCFPSIHVLLTYFTNLYASENKAKYEKPG